MKNLIIVIGTIILAGLLVGGVYLYLNHQTPISIPESETKYPYSEITYDSCVKELLNGLRELPPAFEEPIGAERVDEQGRVWVKSDEINVFDFEMNPIPGEYAWTSESSPASRLTNEAVDEFPRGANYTLNEFPGCEKYAWTRNAKMESRLREIVEEAINEQGKESIFSVGEIEVINLKGRVDGSVHLNCEETIKGDVEDKLIEIIANRLFLEYPDDFAEGSEKNSEVIVWGCSETGSSPDGIHTYYSPTEWIISEGFYDFAI